LRLSKTSHSGRGFENRRFFFDKGGQRLPGDRVMARLNFSSPPTEDENDELLVECERQLRPLIDEIVQAAVTAGWNREDVLLSLAELSWSMFEESRDGSS
jgi:hypothetical protein